MRKLILLISLCIAITSQAHTTNEQQPKSQTQRTINVIGDSYVANHRAPKEQAWHYKMAQAMGMKYNNYGKNGACVAFDRTHETKFNG